MLGCPVKALRKVTAISIEGSQLKGYDSPPQKTRRRGGRLRSAVIHRRNERPATSWHGDVHEVSTSLLLELSGSQLQDGRREALTRYKHGVVWAVAASHFAHRQICWTRLCYEEVMRQ